MHEFINYDNIREYVDKLIDERKLRKYDIDFETTLESMFMCFEEEMKTLVEDLNYIFSEDSILNLIEVANELDKLEAQSRNARYN